MFVKIFLVLITFLLLVALSVLQQIKEQLIKFKQLEHPQEILVDYSRYGKGE